MTTTPPLQPQINSATTLYSEVGKQKFLQGCAELTDDEINEKICEGIFKSLALEMKRMMQKHLRNLKEMHRELMRRN